MTVQNWLINQSVRQFNAANSKRHKILCVKNFTMVKGCVKNYLFSIFWENFSELYLIGIKAKKGIYLFKILVYQSSNNCYRRSIVNDFSTQAARWTIGTWYSLNRTAIAWRSATCIGKDLRRFCPCGKSPAEKPLALSVISNLCFPDTCLSV